MPTGMFKCTLLKGLNSLTLSLLAKGKWQKGNGWPLINCLFPFLVNSLQGSKGTLQITRVILVIFAMILTTHFSGPVNISNLAWRESFFNFRVFAAWKFRFLCSS